MKKVFVLFILFLTCLITKNAFSVSSIKIEVEKELIDVQSDKEYMSPSWDIQSKTKCERLKIMIKNIGGGVLKNINVKWMIYAQDIATSKISANEEESETFSLNKMEERRITSKPFEYSFQKKRWRGGYYCKGGEKYYGYAILVYAGSNLIDFKYSPDNIKKYLIRDNLIKE